MKRVLLHLSVCLASIVAAAEGAHAQDWRPERPYRGLFGGGVGQTTHLLTATASLGTGWYENPWLDLNGVGVSTGQESPRFRNAGYTTSAALSYAYRGAAAVGATAGTMGRYDPGLQDPFFRRDYASVGVSAPLGAGFSGRGSASYQPYSLRSMFPGLYETGLGDPMMVDEDLPASRVQYLTYSAGLDYSRRISRRNTFSANYTYQGRTVVPSSVERYGRHAVGARLTRELGRGLAGYAGYGYGVVRYAASAPQFGYHTVDLGVNYSRALTLSLSRRTFLSFSTGSALYQTVQPESPEPKSFRFNATGTARLSHEIGRTWDALVAYNRGLNFSETWLEPVFADSLSARVGGLLGRRTQLEFTANALRGGGYSGTYGDATSVGATAGLSVGLTRYVSTGLTYAYYSQRFADSLSLSAGFPTNFEGQSIRAAVSVWAPLFQRPRRP